MIAHLEHGRDVIVSNHRCHGHYLAFTDDVIGLLCEVMGQARAASAAARAAASISATTASTRTASSAARCRSPPGWHSPSASAGRGAVTVVFIGDGTLGPGRRLREPQHRLALGAADPVRRREQLLRAVDAEPAHARRRHRRPRRGVRDRDRASSPRPTWPRSSAPPPRSSKASATTRRPFFLVLDTYRFSPHSKGDDNRDPAEIETARDARSARRRRRAAVRRASGRPSRTRSSSGSTEAIARRGRFARGHARGGRRGRALRRRHQRRR